MDDTAVVSSAECAWSLPRTSGHAKAKRASTPNWPHSPDAQATNAKGLSSRVGVMPSLEWDCVGPLLDLQVNAPHWQCILIHVLIIDESATESECSPNPGRCR